ncbi:MAG TPA: hypothetical protein PKY77_19615 [Phycisphaerae bacterium]|nr:hypothetical protein [Phycisphaerae bacterium]HRY71468.1 hypothetical protein [Phycisphaerae bacterium]HSA30017.1 hypothetical protein [Phycisphaerae bacterium]
MHGFLDLHSALSPTSQRLLDELLTGDLPLDACADTARGILADGDETVRLLDSLMETSAQLGKHAPLKNRLLAKASEYRTQVERVRLLFCGGAWGDDDRPNTQMEGMEQDLAAGEAALRQILQAGLDPADRLEVDLRRERGNGR